ncbi:PAN domain-containing protein [Acuticoccus mangrovi]|uniref:Apple domain-containing protein n=1 Tax=Acuticoccus mangrovi TaxID=2796142 RepID=A0A934IKF6_9HYPH|nr:PAN domain-containing protein [Acuticoccus mangrovi]MBJ3774275.1 hypothetical protein [Acuticoccus mangrovi]
MSPSLRLSVAAFFAVFALWTAAVRPASAAGSDIASAVAAGDKRYVLLVGVGEYSHTVPVKYVEENLDAVEKLMRESFFVPDANIRRIVDPSATDLFATFGFEAGAPGDFAGLDIAEPDAELYVYYVGHGTRDLRAAGTSNAAASEGFLLASNSRLTALSHTAYSYDTLLANLDAFQKAHFPQGRVVLFLESCFSGETSDGQSLNPTMGPMIAPPVGWDAPSETSDVIAIAAAGADTPAYWDDERHRGLFTDALVTGLGGAADHDPAANGDGAVTLDELGHWLERRVPTRAAQLLKGRQVPQVSDNAGSGVLLELASIAPKSTVAPSLSSFETEFEIEDYEYRFKEAGARDWPSLAALSNDLGAYMESCGDRCRTYLPRLLPLRDQLTARIKRCEAASAVAERRLAVGRFAAIARLSALCADETDINACVAGRDASSHACGCVVDPGGEGCGIDPVVACAQQLDEAIASARAGDSLIPFGTFQAKANAACLERERGRLAEARKAVCEASPRRNGTGAPPEALIACDWAKTRARELAASRACTVAFNDARAGGPADIGRFIVDHLACAELSDAEALRDRQLDEALTAASGASSDAARSRAADELKSVRLAYAHTLTNAALRRIDDALDTVQRAPCGLAYSQAQDRGSSGLARFISERPECRDEVARARAILADDRCQRSFETVREDDAIALFRFTETYSECTEETLRAQRAIDRLALDCLYDAEAELRPDLSAIDTALRKARSCESRYGSMSSRFSERANTRLAALTSMRDSQIVIDSRNATPPIGSGTQTESGTFVAFYNGLDFNGADLYPRGVKAGSEMACANRCESESGCRAFTFNVRAKVCYLKTNTGTLSPHQDALSGTLLVNSRSAPPLKVSGGSGEILYNHDFPGNDIMSATINNTTLWGCQAACSRNSACAAFSYIERNGQCWLKHSVGAGRALRGVHSGRSGGSRTYSASRVVKLH